MFQDPADLYDFLLDNEDDYRAYELDCMYEDAREMWREDQERIEEYMTYAEYGDPLPLDAPLYLLEKVADLLALHPADSYIPY